MTFILFGLLTGLAIMFLLAKLNMKRLAGYAFMVDLVLTMFIAVWFSGTISGLITGMIAGLFVSVVLLAYVKFIGFDRYSFTNHKWEHTTGYFERWSETMRSWFNSFNMQGTFA